MTKTLIVGDLHGCYTELQDLLEKVGIDEGDSILSVGDLVDRGEESPAVINFFSATPNVRAVMGNHERKHIRAYAGQTPASKAQTITRYQIGEGAYPSAIAYMETLPLFIELDEAIIVHGFFEPHVPVDAQRDVVIVGTLTGELYLNDKYRAPWYTLYNGEKPVIVGHRNYTGTRHPLIIPDRVYGLDTGCVYGGALTGLVLPAFEVVSVPSRADHWENVKQAFRDNGLISDDDD